MLYANRLDAGRKLGQLLMRYREAEPFILALPRGGVVVGHEIARALHAPLDVLVVRKLGAPMNPEFGFGAIAPGGVSYIDHHTVQLLGLTQQEIGEVVEEESAELDRRVRLYRGNRPEPALGGKSVILVDDGLATGGTARAAILYARKAVPARLILAVPVAPDDTVTRLREEVDELICPVVRSDFRAIGEWYQDFEQTTDAEVLELLAANRRQMQNAE